MTAWIAATLLQDSSNSSPVSSRSEYMPPDDTHMTRAPAASVDVSENQKRIRPALAMGLFVFLKSQLEGIKQRAESAVVIDA